MQPRTISRYRVGRLIGAGGMGEVYLAEDETLNRKVALKLLPVRFTRDEERVRRFQREARAASALNHPNIITIYEIGHADSVHYIATEYIEGETLREVMAKRRLTAGEVLDVAIGVSSALAAAHDAGIIHRDIKPENIMLRPDGYVKVLDFGLAKLAEPESALKDSSTGTVLGTLLYISPEQARAQQPDARSDLYALGAVMYEMVTGQPPVRGDNFIDIANAIVNETPKPPSHYVSSVPPELDRIVLKLLEKDRANRYQSARQLLNDLHTLRRELEFENKLNSLEMHRHFSAPGFDEQPTAQMTFPIGTRGRFSLPHAIREWRMIVLMALVLVGLLAAATYTIIKSTLFADKIDSVAVLPFVNASGNPNSEYLSDGLTDSITDSLSQLPELQVVAHSTVFRYKGKNTDPLVVGRELHVRGVVTGRLIQRGNTVVVRASLTDVKRGTQVWGQQYDRNLSDVVALQKDLSDEISSQLQPHLTGEERKLLSRGRPESNEAFQLYLKGRYFATKYNDEESARKGITYFNQSIERDPTYALAYAGLAAAYYQLSNLSMPPREAMPRVREASERALALDDSLAPAHTCLALALTWYDWDFAKGEAEFKRGIALNANDAEAHRLYGDFLTAMGRFDEALTEKRRAEQLDPLSVPTSWDVGRCLYYAGRDEEAIEQAKHTLDLDPTFPYVYYLEAQIDYRNNKLPEALALMQRAMQMEGHKQLLVTNWGMINARAGNRDEALRAMAELRARAVGTYTLPLFLARIYAALGNNDEAMKNLEQVYNDRSESAVWLKVDPSLDTVRSDPRFIALMRKVGLPQ
ncbi:MAG: protein kinase [Acidobacteria bacterium]|nr:protein kinase [Acidobacteriota bacterium]MBV9067315.1 protein kinase [Acidobacteriota bacterium]MBV9188641.1 protein kinase [Acidobacteriota bacterium]